MADEYQEASYRKRPIVIRARRMREPFRVETLEGTMEGRAGDWLITGINGEQYPCADDIFRKTYEHAVFDESASRDRPDRGKRRHPWGLR